MNRVSWGGMLMGIGALTMYLSDPDRGKRRRATVRDSLVHCGYGSRKFLGRFGRDLSHRAAGTLAEAKRQFRDEQVSDAVLQQRIRSILGRAVSHPHAVEVQCKEGSVTLSGQVVAWEADDLRRAVEMVPGVKEVSICLQTAESTEQVAAPQEKMPAPAAGLFGDRWSPTARVLVGGSGLALMMEGLRSRKSLASAPGLVGALMLARSVFNMPLRRVPMTGIHVEKTIRVHAARDDVYAFWANPENYGKVFSHVKQVTPEGEGIYRWHMAGPAGVPLSWTGKITRAVPGRVVEWQSLPGASVNNRGIVRLDEEGDGFTRVHVQMEYAPPAGLLGHAFATLLGIDPRNLMHHDFVQMQSLLERGVTRSHGERVSLPDLGIPPVRASEKTAAGTA